MNLSDFTVLMADNINKQRQFVHEMFTELIKGVDEDIQKLETRKVQLMDEWTALDKSLAELISEDKQKEITPET